MSENKDTDVLPIVKEVKTDGLGPVDDITPTPNDVTPPESVKTEAEILQEVKNLSQVTKGTRKEATIEKEATRLDGSIVDGIIDYDKLANRMTDTKIGKEALAIFAEKNGLEVADIREGLNSSENNKRFTDMHKEIQRLKEAEEIRNSQKESDSFLTYYKETIKRYDLTTTEFDSLYGESFKTLFNKYAGALDKIEAAKLAFELTVGKETDLAKKVEEVKTRINNRRQAASPKPTPPKEEGNNQLLTREEVLNLSDSGRIEYKKKHYNPASRLVTYK